MKQTLKLWSLQKSFEALSSSRTFLHVVKDFASSKLLCFSLCVHHYISRRDVTIFFSFERFLKIRDWSLFRTWFWAFAQFTKRHFTFLSDLIYTTVFFFLKICTSMIKTLEDLENTGIEASRIRTCNTGEVKIQNGNKEKRSLFRRSDWDKRVLKFS